MFDVSFRNESCFKYGIIPVRRPSIPAPEEKIEEIEIPGRNGILTVTEGLYGPITIPVEFNFMSKQDQWGETFRKAKRWLSGCGDLWFSDDSSVYYKVFYCRITGTERTRRIGNFTAEFTCDPYTYYKYGKEEILLESSIYNPGAICQPIYKISGDGLCALTVNGNTFKANVGQEIIIDTYNLLAYREDQMLNSDVTGDYKWLWLNPGDNTLSATNGFTVSIIPEWRDL